MNKKIYGIIAVVIVLGFGLWLILSRGQKPVYKEPTLTNETQTITNGGAPITIRAAFKGTPEGEASQNGIKLAIKEINDNGGINGSPLILASEEQNGPLTDYVSTTVHGADLMIYIDTDIETVFAAGHGTPTTFSTWGRVLPKADKALDYFSKNNLKKITVNTNSSALSDAFKKEAAHYGVQIISNGAVSDALFMDAPTVSNNQTTYYTAVPKSLDQKFADTYKLMYKEDATEAAGTAYDAIYMIARAVKDQPADVSRYMRGVNFKTVGFGNVTFDDQGGITTPENYYILEQVKGGKAVEVK